MRYDLSAPGERKTSNLKLHPLNNDIYGEPLADSALVESVRQNGIFNPIIVNEDGVILSGTRRWAAAKLAGLERVPTIRFLNKDALTEELFLVESNRQRVKTESQKDAEAAALLRIETEIAKERQRQGRTNLADPGAAGRAVDKVATATGESPANVQKRVQIHAAHVDPTVRNQQSTHAAHQNLPKPTNCDICQQQFESRGAMKDHRRKAHADEMAKRKPAWISDGNACQSGKRGFDSVEDLYAARVAEGKTQPVAYFNCRKCGKVHLDKQQRPDAHVKFYSPAAQPQPETVAPSLRSPVVESQAPPAAGWSSQTTPLQPCSETFYVVRRKSDGAFCVEEYEDRPDRSVADHEAFAKTAVFYAKRFLRTDFLPEDAIDLKLLRKKWVFVKIVATYELATDALAPAREPNVFDEPARSLNEKDAA